MEFKAPSPKQARSIREATARVNIWHGAVRAGKNIAAELAFARAVRHHDGIGDIALIGRTERTLERNVLAGHGGLVDLLGDRNVKITRGVGECTIFGRRCYMFGASDARSEGKIRGGTFSLIYGNEITLWPEDVFKMAQTRMSVDGSQFFGETNPDNPRHWLKREYIDREDDLDLRAWHFTIDDNPDLSDTVKAELKAQFTGLWRKRFVDGLWVVAEGAIWDSFDPDVHCPAAVPEGVEILRYYCALDYGTSNPFTCGLFGEGSDGRTWLLDRWRWDSKTAMRQLGDAQYSAKLAEWIKAKGVYPVAWYVDPSAANMVMALRTDHNWNVLPADNDVDAGLRTVATAIASDRFRIVAPNCPEEIGECQGYSWDPKQQEKGKDAPLKVDDHGPDMIRYGLHSHAMLDIGDIEQYGWVA